MLIEMIIIIIKQVKQFFKIKNSGSKKLLKSINLQIYQSIKQKKKKQIVVDY